MHRDARDVAAAQLAFADVQPGSDPEIEPTGRVDDRPRALDTSSRSVEAGKYAVTGGPHHDPAVPFYLGRGRTIVRVEQVAPAPVAEFCGAGRGVDDIGEQHRCEHAVDVYCWLVAGSGIAFDDRGRHSLKGVPGDWQTTRRRVQRLTKSRHHRLS